MLKRNFPLEKQLTVALILAPQPKLKNKSCGNFSNQEIDAGNNRSSWAHPQRNAPKTSSDSEFQKKKNDEEDQLEC